MTKHIIMPNETEGVNPTNNEVTEPTEPTEPEAPADEEGEVDWQAKARELEGRLKRAETKLKKSSDNPAPGKSSTSGGLDYGQKAYLRAEGIKGEAETTLVQQYMRETGKDLEKVLESKFFKAELEEMRELAKTEAANPTGKRTGTTALDSVEYWMAKPLEDVPKEMRTKVVNALIKQSESKGVFYNS